MRYFFHFYPCLSLILIIYPKTTLYLAIKHKARFMEKKTIKTEVKVYKFINKLLKDIRLDSNSVALIKHSINSKKEVVYDVVTISGLRNTRVIDICKHLLNAIVTEKRTEIKWNKELFAKYVSDYNTKNSGIRAKSFMSPYYDTNLIFRTNSKGEIAAAIESKIGSGEITIGMKLKDTAIRVVDDHLVSTCTDELLSQVIYHHAKAAASQFIHVDNINKIIEEFSHASDTIE